MTINAKQQTDVDLREMMLGLNTLVRLADGRKVPAINFDNAATTPPFKQVAEEIQAKLLCYGSIGRGKGQKSAYSTRVYENGRCVVKEFLCANQPKYTVFYTNNTTDGMNKLASALLENRRDIVLTTRMEHHANDLPWRERTRTVYAEVDAKGRLLMGDIERLLKAYKGRIKYVAVTAASNVTGYVNDVHKIAKIAHRHGAQIIVDGAQIVAHRPFSMLSPHKAGDDIDYFVFSAHKMYSPYGGGAVVGLRKSLNKHIPEFYGGGMVEQVTDDDVIFAAAPDCYEAGSPNDPGVVGMLKAMKMLKQIGFNYVKDHEQRLLKKVLRDLKAIPGVLLYGDNENIADRVGIIVFNLAGISDGEVAEKLAQCAGIAVRHAKFCAHPYVDRLLKQHASCLSGGAHTGMVRVSFGIYNTEAEADCLIETIKSLLRGKEPHFFCTGYKSSGLSGASKLPHDRG
ncbi:MAG: aminotransferase class V-fold PLP-dependent enzyme [Firmicutes bacterium]|nr:aminotransferase class V-fold PLP-dependent enzyme [Bacillota bacterium]